MTDVMANMEKLSRNNLDNLRADKKLSAGEQKADMRDKLKERVQRHKQRFAAPPDPVPEAAPAPKQWSARETIALNRRANELHAQQSAKVAEPRRQEKVRKLFKYLVKFPEVCAPFKKQVRVDMSEAEADTLLLRIREALGEKGSKQMCEKILWGGMTVLEKITHDAGFNPMKLQIKGIGGAMNKILNTPPLREKLEPELTEMEIEIGGKFHAPWYARLGIKLAEFVYEFSNGQKRAIAQMYSSRPVNATDLPPMAPPPAAQAPPPSPPPPVDAVAN
jgi:hypothetical protein